MLKARVINGMGSVFFAQLIILAVRFLEIPLFLRYWGVNQYGTWLIISAIPIYLALADFGVISFAGKEIIIKVAAKKKMDAIVVFQSSFWLLVTATFIIFGIVYLVLLNFPYEKLLHISSDGHEQIRFAIMYLALYTLIGFQLDLLYSCLTSDGRYPMAIIIYASSILLEFLGCFFALSQDGGMAGVASGYLFGRVAGLIIFVLAIYKFTPWFRYGFSKVSVIEIKKLFKPSIISMMLPLSNALNIQGIRILTGIFLGPASVVILTSIRTFCRIVIQPSTILSKIIEPEVTMAYGSGNHELMRKIFTKFTQIIFWAGAIFTLFLFVEGGDIFCMWTHNKVILQQPLFQFLMVAAFLNILTASIVNIPASINKHNLVALDYLLFSGLAPLICSLLLLNHFGINGIAFSLMLFEFLTLIILLKVTLKLIDQSYVEWASQVFTPPIFIFRDIFLIFKK